MRLKKNMNYAKIKANAYNIHSETSQWIDLETLWDEQKEAEDEHHFFLTCPNLNNIRQNFT